MLAFGKKVIGGRYQIVSKPYFGKQDARLDIRKYWKKETKVTTYYEEGMWYIIIPVQVPRKEYKGMY